jgi:O-antigen/teichoic acid export membrane protein
MSLNQKIAHNTLIQMSGKIVSTLLGLVVIGLITRYLGQKIGFGQYTTIMAYLQFAGIFAELGLSLVMVQMISEDPENENEIVNNIFTFRMITASLIFGFSLFAVFVIPYDRIIRNGIFLAVTAFFASSLNQLSLGIFQQKLEMFRTTISDVTGRLILLSTTIAIVWYDSGLFALLLANTLASIVHLGMNILFARKWFVIRMRYNAMLFRKIWKKCWPIALSIIFNLIYFKADTLVLSLSQDFGDIGLYGAAYKVLEVLITVPFMFLGLLLPFFTEHWNQRNNEKLKEVAQQAFDVMAMIALPMVFGGIFLGRKIMTLIAGEEYLISGDILKILVIATACIFISNVFTHMIIAIDAQKRMLPWFALVAAISSIGYIIFIPLYSYWAAAWMTVIAESMILCVSSIIVYRLTSFFPKFQRISKAFMASVLMGLLLLLSEKLYISIFTQLIVGILSYGIFLFVLKAVSLKFLKEVCSKKTILS